MDRDVQLRAMPFHRWPLPVRFGLYALATAILLWLTLAPSNDLPHVNLWDKAEHAIAWAVLAATGLVMWPRRPATIAAYALFVGAAVELLQGSMGLGRDMDWHDLVADGVGVAAAVVVWWPLSRTRLWA
jgi:hypothetical protein